MKTKIADAGAAFHTTGDGLRGVPVIVMDRDTGEVISSRVYSNTATRLVLDTVLSRNPDRYDAYFLGAIPFSLESGDVTLGAPQEIKTISYVTFEFERGSLGALDFYMAADQESQTTTAWRYIGTVPLKGRTHYRMPVYDLSQRGRTFRWLLLGLRPGQKVILTHLTFDFETEANFG